MSNTPIRVGGFASQQVVVAGDFNAAARDHFSHRTKSKTGIATSVVDDIIISQRLEEQVLPCSALQVREFGHYAVFTVLDFGVSQIAKLEVVMPDRPLVCDLMLDWNLSYSVESAWSQFCANMDRFFSNKGRPRGTPPVFKLRPKYKHSQLSWALNDAFQRADFEAVGILLQAFQHLDKKNVLKTGRRTFLLCINLPGPGLSPGGFVSLLSPCLCPSSMSTTELPPLRLVSPK